MLEIQNLWYKVEEIPIIQGLNLTIGDRETLCLLGKNGTGKSTLAYLLMNARGYFPCQGKILLDKKDITFSSITEKAKAGITLAWQEPVRFEGLTIRDYLKVGKGNASENELQEIIEAVGLNSDTYLDRMLDTSLSGGERKRIELAAVALMGPKLAILDEPDSGIDILSINEIASIINAMEKRGTSILLITHREEIAKIADRAAILCCGQILIDGPAEEISDHFKSGCTFCTHVNIPDEDCLTNK